jgi:transposase-like protein
LNLHAIKSNEKNLSLQQKLDILHEVYLVPHAIKRTAHKYNVDPNQMCRWKVSLTGLDEEEGQHQLA